MAISKEFLILFTEFIQNYKTNDKSSLLSWGTKDLKHEQAIKHLEELLESIASNQEAFHDSSIIEHFDHTVLLAAETNPYLLKCWIQFLNKYHSKKENNAPFGEIHIKTTKEIKPSEQLISELQIALASMKKSATLQQQAHNTQTQLLDDRIKELEKENLELLRQNSQLTTQVYDQKILQSLYPQIQNAEKHIQEFQQLLSIFNEVARSKTVTTINKQPTPISVATEEQNKKTQPLQTSPEENMQSKSISSTVSAVTNTNENEKQFLSLIAELSNNTRSPANEQSKIDKTQLQTPSENLDNIQRKEPEVKISREMSSQSSLASLTIDEKENPLQALSEQSMQPEDISLIMDTVSPPKENEKTVASRQITPKPTRSTPPQELTTTKQTPKPPSQPSDQTTSPPKPTFFSQEIFLGELKKGQKAMDEKRKEKQEKNHVVPTQKKN